MTNWPEYEKSNTQTVKSLKFWRRWTSLSISEIFTRLRACFSILNRSKALFHSIETTSESCTSVASRDPSTSFPPQQPCIALSEHAPRRRSIWHQRGAAIAPLDPWYASLWHCISKNPHFIQLYPSHFQIQQIHRQVSRPHSSGALVALWGLPFSPKAGRCTCRSWNLRRTSMPNKAQKGKPFPCYFLLCWFQILTNNKKTTGHQPIQDCETHRLSYDVQTVCC